MEGCVPKHLLLDYIPPGNFFNKFSPTDIQSSPFVCTLYTRRRSEINRGRISPQPGRMKQNKPVFSPLSSSLSNPLSLSYSRSLSSSLSIPLSLSYSRSRSAFFIFIPFFSFRGGGKVLFVIKP